MCEETVVLNSPHHQKVCCQTQGTKEEPFQELTWCETTVDPLFERVEDPGVTGVMQDDSAGWSGFWHAGKRHSLCSQEDQSKICIVWIRTMWMHSHMTDLNQK